MSGSWELLLLVMPNSCYFQGFWKPDSKLYSLLLVGSYALKTDRQTHMASVQ
jgi:hypothetical protein